MSQVDASDPLRASRWSENEVRTPMLQRSEETVRELREITTKTDTRDILSHATIQAEALEDYLRLRGAAHPVVNIRTSEHHIPSRPRLSVRMFGSWGKKRANVSSNRAAL